MHNKFVSVTKHNKAWEDGLNDYSVCSASKETGIQIPRTHTHVREMWQSACNFNFGSQRQGTLGACWLARWSYWSTLGELPLKNKEG